MPVVRQPTGRLRNRRLGIAQRRRHIAKCEIRLAPVREQCAVRDAWSFFETAR